ncbi:hypothetical protein BKP45_15755 [Anaerobacillus alkalidiazotrophicus]|uniref:CobW C-terminal domain-containing protein n=1 Tax=Anaerobacillus alkalidiazotrophicus TaxID=472963 RepID=A0A1S2M1Y5_9BACI|nr:GTP-binding protein [Anaerobacillus alkalidiazotrophicus]OIJ18738.1 hypothetical protein BKP45_15755 [Anaerobacillus alkalidiazotrophicus]
MVDVFVLSGFLGSGKSTLLKELIQFEQKQGRRVGVIMNELGSISIDSAIVPDEVPLKELLNGCVCCTLQGELSLQIKRLLENYQLDVIYIEATGAAHPLEIIDACTHPLLVANINVRAVITLVNALQWYEGKMNNKIKKLLVEQIKFADIIVLNKIDKLENSVVEQLLGKLDQINSNARKISSTYAQIDLKLLYMTETNEHKTEQSEPTHVHNHLHLRTVKVALERPIERMKLVEWLEHFQGILYRAKGFVYITETPGLFLFNYAYGDPVFERYSIKETYTPTLVFIGENLDQDEIKKHVNQLYV